MLEVAQKVRRDDAGEGKSKSSAGQVERRLVEEWLCFLIDLFADQEKRRACLGNVGLSCTIALKTLLIEVVLETLGDGIEVERVSVYDNAYLQRKVDKAEGVFFDIIKEASLHTSAALLERHLV